MVKHTAAPAKVKQGIELALETLKRIKEQWKPDLSRYAKEDAFEILCPDPEDLETIREIFDSETGALVDGALVARGPDWSFSHDSDVSVKQVKKRQRVSASARAEAGTDHVRGLASPTGITFYPEGVSSVSATADPRIEPPGMPIEEDEDDWITPSPPVAPHASAEITRLQRNHDALFCDREMQGVVDMPLSETLRTHMVSSLERLLSTSGMSLPPNHSFIVSHPTVTRRVERVERAHSRYTTRTVEVFRCHLGVVTWSSGFNVRVCREQHGCKMGTLKISWANARKSNEIYTPYDITYSYDGMREVERRLLQVVPVRRLNGAKGLHPLEDLEIKTFAEAKAEHPLICGCITPKPIEVQPYKGHSIKLCATCNRYISR